MTLFPTHLSGLYLPTATGLLLPIKSCIDFLSSRRADVKNGGAALFGLSREGKGALYLPVQVSQYERDMKSVFDLWVLLFEFMTVCDLWVCVTVHFCQNAVDIDMHVLSSSKWISIIAKSFLFFNFFFQFFLIIFSVAACCGVPKDHFTWRRKAWIFPCKDRVH